MKPIFRKVLMIVAAGSFFWLGSEKSACAYLDPGTGSMVLQMVLGGIAAFFFTIKLYWKKIIGSFSGKKNPPQPPSKKTD